MNSVLQDLGNSITGNIPKAVLCVRKPINTTGTSLTGALSASGLKGKMMGLATQKSSGAEYSSMVVQYNPSSLHFETRAGTQVSYSGGNMGTAANNQVIQTHQPASTTLNFQLVFDDMNLQDAFMLQNLTPTVGNAVSAGSNIVNKFLGKGYSVKPQVEGLIAMMSLEECRNVIFYWSKMSFRGEVTSVNADYTMFNKEGNPIRAIVSMSIWQGAESEEKLKQKGYETAWDKACADLFKQGSMGGKTFGQATNNNFLNLSI